MEIAHFSPSVIVIITAGFFLAMILGFLTFKAHLSSVPGYLIAGYLIGPYSPGIVAEAPIAEQLAEIGVILMMFNVGLHIKMRDLLSVKNVVIPGAIFQIIVSSLAGMVLIHFMNWPFVSGIIFGIALSVASTMILVKLLNDYKLFNTQEGHISIGWLIVEDLITVLFLILIPVLGMLNQNGAIDWTETSHTIGLAFLNFFVLIVIMATIGLKLVSWVLNKILQTGSTELLTLAVLALTFQIAIGSTYFFGTSLALGAFIAGLVMGQSRAPEKIAQNGEGLKDIFTVIFFLTIGMLFNPIAIVNNFPLFCGALFIILLIKPIAAFFIIYVLKYPIKTAALIALAIAQIGEFSFIVAEEASRLHLLPDEGYDIIIATALVSISLNPLLFKWYNSQNKFQENELYK